MLQFDVITMVVVFGMVQAGFILYFFSLKKRYSPHRYLVATVVVLLIMMIESFFLRSGYLFSFPHIFMVSAPFVFLLGPLCYEYVVSILGSQKQSKWRILHAVPFLFFFLYSFNFFLQPDHLKKALYVQDFRPGVEVSTTGPIFSTDPWGIQGWVVVELLSLHIFLYALVSGLYILRQRKRNGDTDKNKRNWSIYVTGILALGGFILFFSQGGVINGEVFFESPFPHFSPDLYSAIAMYLITLFILGKTEFFKSGMKKYGKSSLSATFKTQKLQHIRTVIEKDQLYLNPEFSLNTLSEASGLSKHHISQILNEELQCTFFQLTNDYRIQEAKNRLQVAGDYTKMEQLAYELGYKSKSTFFTAFKKATDLTPSKYRDKHSN
ncbi:helix-turn-helix domain-containing protein [Aureisphaera galaxeae]|uniref:helix-turn-helix domain-containing protein n=1 Tax=Aureisphaera galaxeae TaxID=1538023 RepID=UPI0023502DAD|nr:helix-turn-helix domain-containing protein [Aureisphaera galaxeae]